MKTCPKCKALYGSRFKSYCDSCTSEYNKARYEANKETIKARQNEYVRKNKEAVKQRNKSYKERNKEQVLSLTRLWKKQNKHKVNAANKNRRFTELKATPKWLTNDDYWMIEQAYELAQLRTKMLGIEFHVDHIIPIKGKMVCGLHVPTNLQVIPALENMRKGNRVF